MSSTKTIWIFRGPCGSGKTFVRSMLSTKLPGLIAEVDMKNAPRGIGQRERQTWLENEITFGFTKANILFVEAIFAPGAPSLEQLRKFCLNNGYELVEITVNRSLKNCLAGIRESGDPDGNRAKFAVDYHHKFV